MTTSTEIQPARNKFETFADWHNYLKAFQAKKVPLTGVDLFKLREQCYLDIEKLRGRPLLVYATQFVGVQTSEIDNKIAIGDVEGFTDLINSIDKKHKKVDILLHSPGGAPDATERIVRLLRERFDDVQFLIPHSAYSAATMLALSGNKILLHPSATLGPIDPQINGIPARSIKNGFEKVKKHIEEDGVSALPAYMPLIQKYSLELLEICEDSEKLSKTLVRQWLKAYMFKGIKSEAIKRRVNKAVKYFSSYDRHLLHSRPLPLTKLTKLDLSIEQATPELELLLWESYILLSAFFSNTAFVKVYECRHGVSWGRQHYARS